MDPRQAVMRHVGNAERARRGSERQAVLVELAAEAIHVLAYGLIYVGDQLREGNHRRMSPAERSRAYVEEAGRG